MYQPQSYQDIIYHLKKNQQKLDELDMAEGLLPSNSSQN